MPSLLDLPLELRQDILTYAFDDAIEKDIRFNVYWIFYLMPDYEILDLLNWFAKLFMKDKGPSVDVWRNDGPWELMEFAVNFYKLTLKLVAIHPQITYDLKFVIDERLKTFVYQLQYLLDDASDIFPGHPAYDPNVNIYAIQGGILWTEWWEKKRLHDCSPDCIKWSEES